MRIEQTPRSRRGSVLPLVAASLVGLCGVIALAVDVGMVAVAKNQCQGAADLAALAGARTLDGSTNSNTTLATTNAKVAAESNNVLSTGLKSDLSLPAGQAGDVTVTHGSYHYDTVTQTFVPQYPPVSPDTYNLTKVTISHTYGTSFAQAIGLTTFNVSATAIAAHRPRDVAIVLDFSGSMNDESDLYNNVTPYTFMGSVNNTPNNTDTIFPSWGSYSSPNAKLQCTNPTNDSRIGLSNVTQSVLGFPAMYDDYFQNARGSTASAAFSPAPASYATTPNGDYFLKKNNVAGNTYAVTYQDINNNLTTKNTNFDTVSPTGGYTYYYNQNKAGAAFVGYTQGPGYWGKTFFVWPPDPSKDATGTTRDWRGKFFLNTGGTYPTFGGAVTDNTKLFNTTGTMMKDPSGNYVINYKAILNWIKTTGPNPFPTVRLRAGNILYYDLGIPTDVPSSAYDHTQANSSITDPTVRFWKEYIDYALGVWRDPYGTIHHPGLDPACSIMPDFTWGTVQVKAKPADGRYMDYADNPIRPGLRFWFGPMTMIQYLSDSGLLPGTANDISMYPAKQGIAAALQDIQTNHPNDMVSLILYSRPKYANDPSGQGAFNLAQFSLSRNYTGMQNALWFPPNSSTLDVRPWDANGAQTPAADNDFMYNTAIGYGMMLAYNQFSANATLQATTTGGLGRKGSQRLVILETDGIANVDSIPSTPFANNGANQSYYHILPGDTVNTDFTNMGSAYDPKNLYQTVQAICNKSDGTAGNSPGYAPNPGYPGFSSAAKPVILHTIAFGAMFESASSGSDQTTAVGLLQQISSIGGTVFPSSSSDATNGYKWCIGDAPTRQTKLRQAFSKIMDDGISVSLVQ